MKKIIAIIVGLLCLGITLRAQTSVEEDLDPKYAAELIAKGQAVPDFTLNDINGKSVKSAISAGRRSCFCSGRPGALTAGRKSPR